MGWDCIPACVGVLLSVHLTIACTQFDYAQDRKFLFLKSKGSNKAKEEFSLRQVLVVQDRETAKKVGNVRIYILWFKALLIIHYFTQQLKGGVSFVVYFSASSNIEASTMHLASQDEKVVCCPSMRHEVTLDIVGLWHVARCIWRLRCA